MKLPFLNKETEPTHEYFLALLLNDEKASAVIFETIENKIKILNQKSIHLPESIETISLTSLIDYVDKVISTAEEVLPPKVETHKTVFGVKENWIEQETKKIKKEYLTRLKKVCDNLDLSPLGFMVLSEALSNLVQQEEGAPLSAILAEIGRHRVDLTLFRGGKIVERISGKVVESVPVTVDGLLKHFTTPVLPARLIISDSDKAEELSQQFITFQWSKSLPFLHVPQVTVLPSSFDAKSIVFGAAQQLGFEAPEIIHDVHLKPIIAPQEEVDEKHESVHEKEPEQREHHTEEHHLHHLTEESAALPTNPFGFLMEQDIALMEPQAKEENFYEEAQSSQEESAHHAAALHQAVEIPESSPIHTHYSDNLVEPTYEDKSDEQAPEKEKRRLPEFHMPKFSLPSFGGGGLLLKLGIPIVLLALLLGGIVYYYLYKVQATVILSVSPKMVQQTTDITFSTSQGNSFSENVIAAKSITATTDGKASTNATGSKDVGNRAKGSVTLYNSSDTSQDVSSGSTIKSSNGLVFTTDKAVTIPAASGDIFTGTKPGTTDVSVTANDIGTDYNLPSGTTFTVSDSLAAKNSSAFSGGNKKTVTVIAQKDLTKLKADLANQLQQNGSDKLTQQTSGNDVVLPVVLNQSLSKTTYSGNVGDQASKVTISGTVTFSGISYNTDDLTQYAQSMLKDKYSQNISFSDNSVKETVNSPKAKNGKEVSASVDIQAGLLPKIDTDTVLQDLAGKSPSAAKETLSHLPQVSNVDIQFSPNIPLLPSLLPKLPKNVSVQIKPES